MDEHINDETLTAYVSKKLGGVTGDTSDVRVEVEDGVVYLDGVVSNPKLRNEIEETARNTDGVGNVVNSIVVEHIVNLAHSDYSPVQTSQTEC
jgi:osmotically-inducible protein OsmY